VTREDWIAWTVALTRPARVDDEEVPRGVVLIPWWNWAWLLNRHGKVTRMPLGRLRLPEVLQGQHLGPVPSDWCNNEGVCTGACEGKP
jgi:hypothetical protein